MSSFEAKAEAGIRYFGGTPSGYRPSAMYARFSCHRTPGSSGLPSRTFRKCSTAFATLVLSRYGGALMRGRRQKSPGVRYRPLSISALCRNARPSVSSIIATAPGTPGVGNLLRDLPPGDRLVHVSEVGVDLRPRILAVHDVELRLARAGCADGIRILFQPLENGRDRLGPDPAHLAQVLIPPGRLREREEHRVRFAQPAHVEAVAHRPDCGRGQDAGGIGFRRLDLLGVGQHFHDGVAARNPHDAGQLAAIHSLKRVSQLLAERGRIQFSQVAAVAPRGVGGLFEGERGEVGAALQLLEEPLRLVGGRDDDHAQAHGVRRDALPGNDMQRQQQAAEGEPDFDRTPDHIVIFFFFPFPPPPTRRRSVQIKRNRKRGRTASPPLRRTLKKRERVRPKPVMGKIANVRYSLPPAAVAKKLIQLFRLRVSSAFRRCGAAAIFSKNDDVE